MIDRDEVAARIFLDLIHGRDFDNPFATPMEKLAKESVKRADVLMKAISEANAKSSATDRPPRTSYPSSGSVR